MDPNAGRKKITEEARMQESIKASLSSDLKAAGWSKQANKPAKDSKKEGKKDKKKEGKGGGAKVSRLCPEFNSNSGCSVTGDSCPKGFLASMHVGVAVNLGGFNWEKRDGSFLEKIGKNFEVEGNEIEFAVLGSTSAVWVTSSGLSSSVSSGSFFLGLFRESLSVVT